MFYGDAEKPAVLRAIGAEEASMVVIALDDHQVMGQLISSIRANFPQLTILARGHNLDHCEKLKSLGADVVVSETWKPASSLPASL